MSDAGEAEREGTGAVDRAGRVALRMMAGMVSAPAAAQARKLMEQDPDHYPWEKIVATVLDEDVDRQRLLERGLRAQRDWLALRTVSRTDRAAHAARTAGRKLSAYLLSRAIFFALYTLAVVVLLVLLKHRWPAVDVYRLLDWLKTVLPGVFGA